MEPGEGGRENKLSRTREHEGKIRLVDALHEWLLDGLVAQVGGGRVSCGGNTHEGPLLDLSLALVNTSRINIPVHGNTRARFD